MGEKAKWCLCWVDLGETGLDLKDFEGLSLHWRHLQTFRSLPVGKGFDLFDLIVTTKQRCDVGGKLWALDKID